MFAVRYCFETSHEGEPKVRHPQLLLIYESLQVQQHDLHMVLVAFADVFRALGHDVEHEVNHSLRLGIVAGLDMILDLYCIDVFDEHVDHGQ